jgi:hypothetical protein
MRLRVVVAVSAMAVAGALAGCQPAANTSNTSAASAETSAAPHALLQSPSAPTARPHHARRAVRSTPDGDVLLNGGRVVLPNRRRTPGAVNAAVTQATIRSTICLTGYTKTIRPPSSYTTSLKVTQLGSGYAFHGDRSVRDYEEDHLIALELGGAPTQSRNLWPEPYAAARGAKVKDLVENQLHDLVCSGRLSLRSAQRAIAGNWWRAYLKYGGRGVPTVYFGTYASAGSSSTSTSTSTSGGATARCVDGTLSYSAHRSGTCSHHGGVAEWINPPPS